MKLDFDVLARVFVAVRPKAGKQGGPGVVSQCRGFFPLDRLSWRLS